MKPEVGQYVIGKIRTEESHITFLGKVTALSQGVVEGVQEKDCHLKTHRKLFEIPFKDVVLNLGSEPYPGTVLKFDTSHLYTGKQKLHDFFGPIHFFYRPEKEVGLLLLKAFDRCAAILEKAGLPQPELTVWEVNPKATKGKYAGYYKHSSNPAKNPHRFAIKPESMPGTLSYFCYVILHEYAHWLDRNWVQDPKIKAAWIRLFNTSIKPQTIDKEVSKRLLARLIDGEERPSDFRGQLEEDERNAFNWIVRTIGTEHAVSIRELDVLFEAEDKDEISSLWPKRTLTKKELAPVVSEYATKNVHELFAETFSFHFTKQKIPQGITALLEKTMKRLEAPEERTETQDDE